MNLKNRLFISRYTFLILTFILMCILKNPFTLSILFIVAIVLTIVNGNNMYCNYLCPLGTITSDKRANIKLKNIRILKFIGIVSIVLFWIIFLFIFYQFYITKNYLILWVYSLRLMVGTITFAVVSSLILKKNRVFCIYMCPLRITILNNILRMINKRKI